MAGRRSSLSSSAETIAPSDPTVRVRAEGAPRSGVLVVQAGPEDTARINRALVLADVDVTGLRQEVQTLEEVFLQMTGSELESAVR